ncbi:hypothetical protein GCQ56_04120 [Marinifilum sp. N1E240]|uniref:PepSY domain-containing protein n=1 Tax=Marinifilum sp. N1E240 TaxID=2608082 RepID=UPI00128DE02A|nr:PepSY domain-containing protein [Marinifilum sp. N1E240]MPQ46189.1 hypothetical protein [Marinifilum sp. N1E240]
MKRLKNILIQIHNFTGTLLSLMFLIWFLSGFVLIYAGFPHAPQEKIFDKLEVFSQRDLAAIQLPPSDFTGIVTLEKMNGEPVYRCSKGRGSQKVYSALSLEEIPEISKQQAIRLTEKFSGSQVQKVEKREQLDQWMPWSYYRPLLPFYLCYVDNEEASRLYVSAKSGSIVQETDRASRWAARLGAIPHWIYFKSLRLKTGLWLDVVAWISGIGVLVSITGLIAGILRLRRRREKETLSELTPYKKFWYKWHHITGFVFGVFVFTFILSGLVSVSDIPQWMAPVHSESSARSMWRQELQLREFPQQMNLADILKSEQDIRKVLWKTVMNKPCLWVYGNDFNVPHVYQLSANRFQLKATYTEVDLKKYLDQISSKQQKQISLLQEYDAYYQHSKKRNHPLPVWKIDFKDEDHTSLYIHPSTGDILSAYNTNTRWRRWLYSGLHTFDFPFLAKHEWLRKFILIFLSLGGTFVSVSGVVLGAKWIKKKVIGKISKPELGQNV